MYIEYIQPSHPLPRGIFRPEGSDILILGIVTSASKARLPKDLAVGTNPTSAGIAQFPEGFQRFQPQ